MNNHMKHKIIGTIICLATMGIFILFQDLLPDVVPVQITVSGEVGNTLPKSFVMFGIPLLFSFINLLQSMKLTMNPNTKPFYFYIFPLICVILAGVTIYMGATLG